METFGLRKFDELSYGSVKVSECEPPARFERPMLASYHETMGL